MFYPHLLVTKTLTESNIKFILIFLMILISAISSHAGCEYKSDLKVDELQIGNMISWITVSEINTDKFIIQKSKDGIDFEIVGEIPSAGNSSEEKKYRYLDTSLGGEKAYFRLVQVDKGGAENYTPTVLVNRNVVNNFMITSMSSTQTDGIFSVSIRSNLDGNLALNSKGISGKNFVESMFLPIVGGLNVLTIDIADYDNGLYELDFILVGEKESIVIQKVDTDKVPNINYVVKK